MIRIRIPRLESRRRAGPAPTIMPTSRKSLRCTTAKRWTLWNSPGAMPHSVMSQPTSVGSESMSRPSQSATTWRMKG